MGGGAGSGDNNTAPLDPPRFGYKQVTYQPNTSGLVDLPVGPSIPDVDDEQGPVYVDFRGNDFEDVMEV
jgi:hypothetical protein